MLQEGREKKRQAEKEKQDKMLKNICSRNGYKKGREKLQVKTQKEKKSERLSSLVLALLALIII